MTQQKAKKSKGRPKIEFTDADIRKIEKWSGEGLNLDMIAALLRIAPKTLDRRIADDPRIKDATLYGRAKSASQVTNKMFQLAMAGDVRAGMFYLTMITHTARALPPLTADSPDKPEKNKLTLNYSKAKKPDDSNRTD